MYPAWYNDPNQRTVYEDTPTAVIHFATGRLIGLIDNAIYSINMIDYMAELSSIEIVQDWYGKSIEVVKKVSRVVGPGSISNVIYRDSDPQVLSIPAKPDGSNIDPLVSTVDATHGGDGRLIGLTSDMEFKHFNDVVWKDAAVDSPDNLLSGSYHVRYKATNNSFASTSVIKVINSQ
jgi:hypothetical protein